MINITSKIHYVTFTLSCAAVFFAVACPFCLANPIAWDQERTGRLRDAGYDRYAKRVLEPSVYKVFLQAESRARDALYNRNVSGETIDALSDWAYLADNDFELAHLLYLAHIDQFNWIEARSYASARLSTLMKELPEERTYFVQKVGLALTVYFSEGREAAWHAIDWDDINLLDLGVDPRAYGLNEQTLGLTAESVGRDLVIAFNKLNIAPYEVRRKVLLYATTQTPEDYELHFYVGEVFDVSKFKVRNETAVAMFEVAAQSPDEELAARAKERLEVIKRLPKEGS